MPSFKFVVNVNGFFELLPLTPFSSMIISLDIEFSGDIINVAQSFSSNPSIVTVMVFAEYVSSKYCSLASVVLLPIVNPATIQKIKQYLGRVHTNVVL